MQKRILVTEQAVYRWGHGKGSKTKGIGHAAST